MIYLRTGLPGASKTLNSLRELVLSYDPSDPRPMYYNNIKLLMLDMDVAQSFSGWFYGWYFRRLEDKAQKTKLIKIMKPIHDNDEFVTLDDVPFLRNAYESHRHFDTWLYWVNRVYQKPKLNRLHSILDCMTEEQINSPDVWEAVKVCNLHFTQFEDPNLWFELPKKSIVLIDECQQFFPPRPAGSRKPEAISKLETHRHGGYDLHFITQHSSLADQNLRKLVGRHIHFYNPFGGKRISRLESPKCFNPDDFHDKKQAKRKFTAHDTNFYGVYWSAEIHTHKFQFPKMLLVALLAILAVLGGVGYVIHMLNAKTHPQDQASEVSSSPAQSVQTESNNQVSVEPAQSMDDILSQYLNDLAKDVYINGSMSYYSGDSTRIDYVFYRSTDDAVFHPGDVGFKVEPITPCLANLIVGDVRKPVTCNPFYVRVPVDDEDESSDFDGEFFGGSDDEV